MSSTRAEFVLGHPVQLSAGHDAAGDVEFSRDDRRGGRMVTGEHPHGDPRPYGTAPSHPVPAIEVDRRCRRSTPVSVRTARAAWAVGAGGAPSARSVAARRTRSPVPAGCDVTARTPMRVRRRGPAHRPRRGHRCTGPATRRRRPLTWTRERPSGSVWKMARYVVFASKRSSPTRGRVQIEQTDPGRVRAASGERPRCHPDADAAPRRPTPDGINPQEPDAQAERGRNSPGNSPWAAVPPAHTPAASSGNA